MIEELYKEHLNKKFPAGYGGEEINGIDLALLDADTAGCIDTFLTQRRINNNLDLWRTAILGICYRNLSVVVQELTGEAKEYFKALETMARLTLEAIRNAEKQA